jgi:hypothetical protein
MLHVQRRIARGNALTIQPCQQQVLQLHELLDPVVRLPLASVGELDLDAAFRAEFVDMVGVFAIDAVEVGLALNIA